MENLKYEHDYNHLNCEKKSKRNQKTLLLASIIIGLFMFVEFFGGIFSGSLALISDAGHMFSDFMALTMAFIASIVSLKKPDKNRTYGYSRFTILVAYSNALFMILVVTIIFYSAIERLFNPVEILSTEMLIIAIIGLLINILVYKILSTGNKEDSEDLNLKSAMIHVLGDLLGSIAAIVAAIVIMFTNWTPIDAILSIIITIIIISHTIPVLKKSSHILMQGSPNINIEKVREVLVKKIENIVDADHIHLWFQDDSKIIGTMHVKTKEKTKFNKIKKEIRSVLITDFDIDHVTIELEEK